MKTRAELLGMLATLTARGEAVLQNWDTNRLAEAVRDLGAYARECRASLSTEE